MKSKRLSNKKAKLIIVAIVLAIIIFIHPEKLSLVDKKVARRAVDASNAKPAYVVSAVATRQTMTEKEFLAYTLRVFQPRSSRRLTDEDAREITRNAVGLFDALTDWQRGRS